MDDGVKLSIAPDGESVELCTCGISGCTIVAVLAEYADGWTDASLSHFQHQEVLQHGNMLWELWDGAARPRRALARILTKGAWGEESNGQLRYAPEERVVRYLTGLLRELFGEGASVSVKVYGIGQAHGSPDVFLRVEPHESRAVSQFRYWEAEPENL